MNWAVDDDHVTSDRGSLRASLLVKDEGERSGRCRDNLDFPARNGVASSSEPSLLAQRVLTGIHAVACVRNVAGEALTSRNKMCQPHRSNATFHV